MNERTVRFMDPTNAVMYDAEGNILKCKCGKPAALATMGQETYVAWCVECIPLYNAPAKFIYRPPHEKTNE